MTRFQNTQLFLTVLMQALLTQTVLAIAGFPGWDFFGMTVFGVSMAAAYCAQSRGENTMIVCSIVPSTIAMGLIVFYNAAMFTIGQKPTDTRFLASLIATVTAVGNVYLAHRMKRGHKFFAD